LGEGVVRVMFSVESMGSRAKLDGTMAIEPEQGTRSSVEEARLRSGRRLM